MVGDIPYNLKKHIEAANTARDQYAAEVIVFPELGLTGYPPEDLLLRKDFLDQARVAFQKLISEVKNIYCLVGHPDVTDHGVYNACSLIYNGAILGRYNKQHLPNYGVFDEYRYFIPGKLPCVIPIHDIPIGLIICEDLWSEEPVLQAKKLGAQLILSLNASPFESTKHEERVATLSKRAKHHELPIAYVNQVGGQDELIFDGGSMLVDQTGKLSQCAGFFNETLMPVELEWTPTQIKISSHSFSVPNKEERIYQALQLATKDYVEKNNFPSVLIGLSGGIDSALTLAIAHDALGKDRVKAVMMPSRYTSKMSMEDAKETAKHLDIHLEIISIEPVYQQFLESLAPFFIRKKQDITEENIQARCRGVILMALSNKDGSLVLTTGNRSELAVGYCTLYGDMAGGFAVLKDIPKTLVYQLVNYRNQLHPVIPESTILRPPSAELNIDQKDEDLLPPYPILDQMLDRYLNQGQSIDEIVAAGFDREMVNKIIKLIHKNEYKRRQIPIGPRINRTSFGKDWRYPVTNHFIS